jgi:hypothetical protein
LEEKTVRTILVALVFGVAAASQAEVQCFFSVRSATDRESRTTWQTSWGSYNKEKSQRKFVRVQITNTSKTDVDFEIKVYFVAEGLDGKGRAIYSVKTEAFSLEDGEKWEGVLVSDILRATDDRYRALGTRERTGGKYDGWVLVLSGNGETVKVADSKRNRRYREKILKLAEEEGE